MTVVGIYVDGPNVERGLFDAREVILLENFATILVEYCSTVGEITDKRLFLDEGNIWRYDQMRDDYIQNGFRFIESRSFKHMDPHTGAYSFGKSLTDPSMHCSIVDRLHDADCPDLFVVVTGDKDVSIVLDYIAQHKKKALVLGEAHSLSGFLVSRCDALGFDCHVIQLIARSSPTMKRLMDSVQIVSDASKELHVTDPTGSCKHHNAHQMQGWARQSDEPQ